MPVMPLAAAPKIKSELHRGPGAAGLGLLEEAFPSHYTTCVSTYKQTNMSMYIYIYFFVIHVELQGVVLCNYSFRALQLGV